MSPGLKKEKEKEKAKTSATGIQIDFFMGNYIFSLILPDMFYACGFFFFFPFKSKPSELCEYDFLIGTLT